MSKQLVTSVLSAAPAGTSMYLSWCCPRPAWWATWTSSLSWMPTSSTFLRSRSLYWRTKHPGWAKSAVRTLLWDLVFMKAAVLADCSLQQQCFDQEYHISLQFWSFKMFFFLSFQYQLKWIGTFGTWNPKLCLNLASLIFNRDSGGQTDLVPSF